MVLRCDFAKLAYDAQYTWEVLFGEARYQTAPVVHIKVIQRGLGTGSISIGVEYNAGKEGKGTRVVAGKQAASEW